MGSILCRGKKKTIYLKFKWGTEWRREKSGFTCTGSGKASCRCVGHKESRYKLMKIERDITTGIFDYTKEFPDSAKGKQLAVPHARESVTFRIRALLWLENKENKAPGTYLNYRYNTEKLLSWFGDKTRIKDICVSDIESLVAHYSRTLSGKSIQNLLGVLSGIMNSAFRDRIIPENPVSLVGNRPGISRELPPVFSLDQVLAMLEYCEQSKDVEQQRFAALIALGAFVGCRIYESLVIQPGDIDLKRRKLHVKRTLSARKLKSTTKTGKSRVVDIPGPAIPYLETAINMSGEYIFPTATGDHYSDSNFIGKRYWKPMLKELGLPLLDLRLFRHTFINMSIRAGSEFAWIRDQAGHTDLKMIMKHYANIQQESPGAGVPAFEKYINIRGPNMDQMDQDLDQDPGCPRTSTDVND